MAITLITVTKVSTVERFKDQFDITWNLVCMDGEDEVINRNFTIPHKQAMNPTDSTVKLQDKMKEYIDSYKAARTIQDHAAMAAAVDSVQNELRSIYTP